MVCLGKWFAAIRGRTVAAKHGTIIGTAWLQDVETLSWTHQTGQYSNLETNAIEPEAVFSESSDDDDCALTDRE